MVEIPLGSTPSWASISVNDLVFFISFGGPGGGAVRSTLQAALYDGFFPRREAPPLPTDGFKERAARYAGTYGFWRSNFSTIEKALGLASVVSIVPTDNDTLALSLGGEAKQYAEVEDNLFREMSPNFSILGGMSPRLVAFQEDDSGNVTGFVIDGLPFMSLRKLKFWQTPNFNFTLLGLSLLILLAVLLRRFYQRKALSDLEVPEKKSGDCSCACRPGKSDGGHRRGGRRLSRRRPTVE